MTISFELWSSIEHQFFFCLDSNFGLDYQNWAGRIQNTWAHMKKIKDTNHVLASNQSPLGCLIEWSCIM